MHPLKYAQGGRGCSQLQPLADVLAAAAVFLQRPPLFPSSPREAPTPSTTHDICASLVSSTAYGNSSTLAMYHHFMAPSSGGAHRGVRRGVVRETLRFHRSSLANTTALERTLCSMTAVPYSSSSSYAPCSSLSALRGRRRLGYSFALPATLLATMYASPLSTARRFAIGSGRRPTFHEIDEALSVLGVSIDVEDKTLKKKYRELVKKNHPDAGGDETTMARITVAYERIADLSKREKAEYKQQKEAFRGGSYYSAASTMGTGRPRYAAPNPNDPFYAARASQGQYYQQGPQQQWGQRGPSPGAGGQDGYWSYYQQQQQQHAGQSSNPFNSGNPFSMFTQVRRARFMSPGSLLIRGFIVYMVLSAILIVAYRAYRDWKHDDGWRMSESLARHEAMEELHRLRQEMNERARLMRLEAESSGNSDGGLPAILSRNPRVGETAEQRALEYARQRRLQLLEEQQREAARTMPEMRGWPHVSEEQGRVYKRAQDPVGIVFFEPRRQDDRTRQIVNRRRDQWAREQAEQQQAQAHAQAQAQAAAQNAATSKAATGSGALSSTSSSSASPMPASKGTTTTPPPPVAVPSTPTAQQSSPQTPLASAATGAKTSSELSAASSTTNTVHASSLLPANGAQPVPPAASAAGTAPEASVGSVFAAQVKNNAEAQQVMRTIFGVIRDAQAAAMAAGAMSTSERELCDMLENLLRIGLATPSDLQAVGFTNSEIAAAAGTTIPPAKAATPHRRSPDPHAAAAARHSNGSRSEEEEDAGAHHESSAKKLLDGAGGKQSTPPARDSHGHRERRSKRSGVVRSRSQSDDAESEKEPSSSPSSSNSSDSSSSSQWTLTARESEAPPPRTASAAATTTTTTDAVNAAPSHSDPHDVTSLTTDVTKASVSEESREAHLRASALVERARVLNTGPGSPWLGHGPSLSYPASSAPETPTSRSMHPPSTNWGVPRLIPDDENQEPCNAPPTTTTTTTTNAAGGESGKNSALRFTGVDAMVAKEIAWHLQQKEHMVEEREEPLEE